MTGQKKSPSFDWQGLLEPKRALLIIAAVALLFRGLYFAQGSGEADFTRLVVDSEAYDRAARGLLEGTWPGDEIYYQDPLYPYFLAGIYATLGDDPRTVYSIQMILGVAGALLIYFIALNMAGRREAFLAGLLAATFQTLLFYEGIVLKTALGVFLVEGALLSILLARERQPWVAMVAGLFLGLAMLVRANLLLVLPVAVAWLLLPWRSHREGDPSWQSRLIRGGVLTGAMLLAISPFTLHNIRAGHFVLTTSQAGQNFYIGNNPGNDSGTYRPPPEVRAHPFFEQEDFKRLAEAETGREMTPPELSSFWMGKAREFIFDEPKEALGLFALKAKVFVNHHEVPDNVSMEETARYLSLLRAPLPSFALVFVLGVGGYLASFLMAARQRERFHLLALVFLVMMGSVVLFFNFARYRMTVVPILIVFSSILPFALWDHRNRWSSPRYLIAFIGMILAVLITSREVYQDNKGTVLYNRAINAYRDGDKKNALDLMGQALELTPGSVTIRLRYGMLLSETGDHGRAEAEIRSVLFARPEDAMAHRELGKLLALKGDHVEALKCYEAALQYDPGETPAALGAAQSEYALARPSDAIARLEQWVRAHPAERGVRNTLGTLYARESRFEEAKKAFEGELEIDPGNQAARQNLDRCLKALGE